MDSKDFGPRVFLREKAMHLRRENQIDYSLASLCIIRLLRTGSELLEVTSNPALVLTVRLRRVLVIRAVLDCGIFIGQGCSNA